MSSKLYAVMGPPGVGKTTVAEYIRDQAYAVHLQSDSIRKQLFDTPDYTSAESTATYAKLFGDAVRKLQYGNVVLDATFSEQSGRERAAQIATAFGIEPTFVRVRCDSDVVRERIQNRDGLSDADFGVYQDIASSFDPVSRDHVVVDNTFGVERTREQVEDLVI